MLPLNYDQAVLDKNGNMYNLTEYIVEHGGSDPEPISDSIVEFDSDDTIQNPTERISMPLLQSGNALKDIMNWISKAFQNIRYLLKYSDELSDDIDSFKLITASNYVSGTYSTTGYYYWWNGELWYAIKSSRTDPKSGANWRKVINIMREVGSAYNRPSIIMDNITFDNNDDVFYITELIQGEYMPIFGYYESSTERLPVITISRYADALIIITGSGTPSSQVERYVTLSSNTKLHIYAHIK